MFSRISRRHIIIFVTCGSKREARKISKILVSKKLAACGNVIPAVESIFSWKGKLERSRETMLVLKTRGSLFESVVSQVQRIHSYEVPEIICVPIVGGNRAYLKWIDEVTGKK